MPQNDIFYMAIWRFWQYAGIYTLFIPNDKQRNDRLTIKPESLTWRRHLVPYEINYCPFSLENSLMWTPLSWDIVTLLFIRGSPVRGSAFSIVSKVWRSFTITKPASVRAYCSAATLASYSTEGMMNNSRPKQILGPPLKGKYCQPLILPPSHLSGTNLAASGPQRSVRLCIAETE